MVHVSWLPLIGPKPLTASTQSVLSRLCVGSLPPHFVSVVEDIYSRRSFRVKDCGVTSERHEQKFGICQGCPLSPFLFTIVMTCVMTDARQDLSEDLGETLCNSMSDLLYADDTLLMGSSSEGLSSFLGAVCDAGGEYGLSLNVHKTKALNVRANGVVSGPAGQPLETKPSMTYLGGLLHSDGRSTHELSRRMGKALAEFDALRRVWSRSALTLHRKLEIFEACVISTLMYGLRTSWFNKAARRRLDGFQARCLRKILRVPPSFYSRVPNSEVLRRADALPLSAKLLEQQLLFFGDAACRSPGPIRNCIFEPGTLNVVDETLPRRTGRPRNTWAGEVMKHSLKVAGGMHSLKRILLTERSIPEWRALVVAHCRRQPCPF